MENIFVEKYIYVEILTKKYIVRGITCQVFSYMLMLNNNAVKSCISKISIKIEIYKF